MSRRSHFPPALLLAKLLAAFTAALLGVSLLGAAAQADDTTPTSPTGTAVPVDIDDTLAQDTAVHALETVQDIVDPANGQAAGNANADLTTALRDLALTRDDLPRNLQDDAAALLARPNCGDPAGGMECSGKSSLPHYSVAEATPVCGGGICVHYVPQGSGDGNAASLNNAQVALQVMNQIANRYVAAGYNRPVGDGSAGSTPGGAGNGVNVFDVYLADLGNSGLYGYCTTDSRVSGHTVAPAYCVLDNDYSPSQYGPYTSPTDNLRVTAAHEYFHAVQFAYDVNEDSWLLEATATWAEDEVYPTINDNLQYLKAGPLGIPSQPLDSRLGLAPYGAWAFFKFLSERYPALNAPGGMPVIVRDIWNLAVGPAGSRAAIEAALAGRGTDLRTEFGLFSAVNRNPAGFYSDGAAYPVARAWKSVKMKKSRRNYARSTKIDHLASRTVRFTSRIKGHAKLRVHVDVANRKKGGYVVVTIKRRGLPPILKVVKISKRGAKTKSFAFGKKKVEWVEVTLVNAGKRSAKASISAQVRGGR